MYNTCGQRLLAYLQLQLGIRDQLVLLLDQSLGGQHEAATMPHVFPLEQLAGLVVAVGQMLQWKDAWRVIDAQDQGELRQGGGRSPLGESLYLCHAVTRAKLDAYEATLDQALEVAALLEQLQRASTEEQLVHVHGILDEGA